MLGRLNGVREIAHNRPSLLPTRNFSSISHALRRASGVRFLRELISHLQDASPYNASELVALDSMAVTFGKTRRHHCQHYNNRAVGGGVLWAYRIDAPPNACPVRLIKTVRGAWNDAGLMHDVALQPQGPLYLMDRGFYCINLIDQWLEQKVRFILRIKARQLQYDVVRHLSPARGLQGGWRLELDAIVVLGSGQRRSARPQVRLVMAVSLQGEQFAYATSENTCEAWQVVTSYKQRWHIERFHRFLKQNLGLAHLYSYDANGLEFQLLAALLAAMLLFTTAPVGTGSTLSCLEQSLSRLRLSLGIRPPWRRNILAVKRCASKHNKRVTPWRNP